jgi:hypothetical protein
MIPSATGYSMSRLSPCQAYTNLSEVKQAVYREGDFFVLLQTYDEIQNLPILEMLNLLDDVVNQFDQFAVDYEINNRMKWRMWFVKYWWSIPAMLGRLILVCLKYAKTFGFVK